MVTLAHALPFPTRTQLFHSAPMPRGDARILEELLEYDVSTLQYLLMCVARKSAGESIHCSPKA